MIFFYDLKRKNTNCLLRWLIVIEFCFEEFFSKEFIMSTHHYTHCDVHNSVKELIVFCVYCKKNLSISKKK